MRREHALVWIALGCGIALLLAPLGDRTYWEQWGQGISRNYDNMPYDFLAFFAGVVAIVGLIFAVLSHPHRRPMVLGAVAAIPGFALTAGAYGFYWWEVSRGIFRVDGDVWVPDDWTIHPMAGYRWFAIAAAMGAMATLTLTLRWRQRIAL